LPFWTLEWNWVFQKPNLADRSSTLAWTQSAQRHEPKIEDLAPAQVKQQALEQKIVQLERQLQSTQHIAEVASREVENLHNGKLFKLAEVYWHWRDRLRHFLWPFGKRDSK